MPIGGFLDSMPTAVFVIFHIIFLLVGLWVVMKASKSKAKFALAFWLYILSQVGFLAVLGGIFTLKMGVLLEQILILIMVIWIATKAK